MKAVFFLIFYIISGRQDMLNTNEKEQEESDQQQVVINPNIDQSPIQLATKHQQKGKIISSFFKIMLAIIIAFLVSIAILKSQLAISKKYNQGSESHIQLEKSIKSTDTIKSKEIISKGTNQAISYKHEGQNNINPASIKEKKVPSINQSNRNHLKPKSINKPKEGPKLSQKQLQEAYLLPKFNRSKLQHKSKVEMMLSQDKQYINLPINTLFINKDNKTIADYLYLDEKIQKERIQFQKKRQKFIKTQEKLFPQLFIAIYNNALDQQWAMKGVEANEKDWLRLDEKFKFTETPEELPICVVVPGYNNNDKFRIEYNLNSIFMQNYTNYKVIIIDDASNDSSIEVYRKYLQFYKINPRYYTLIVNEKRVTALPNHYFAVINHCHNDSIVLNIDGDDEYIGRNVFQLFNNAYQKKKAGMVYTNYYWYNGSKIIEGFTKAYSEHERNNSLYRSLKMKFSQTRSFRAELIYHVDPANFLDHQGNFFKFTADQALFFPLMQLSCGRVHKIQGQINYLYNTNTGINDFESRDSQRAVQKVVRGRRKLQCFKDFDDRMKK